MLAKHEVALLGVAGLLPSAALSCCAPWLPCPSSHPQQLLRERGELDSRFGQATLGILLLQDIATVPFLVLLPLIEGNNAGGWWWAGVSVAATAAAAGGRCRTRGAAACFSECVHKHRCCLLQSW